MKGLKTLVVCLMLALFTSGCATSTLLGIWLGTGVASVLLEAAHEDKQDKRLTGLEQGDEAADPNEVKGVNNAGDIQGY